MPSLRDQLGRPPSRGGGDRGDVRVAQRRGDAIDLRLLGPLRTSTTMSGDAERPVARSTVSRASTDSDAWSSKSSSESSMPTTGPP